VLFDYGTTRTRTVMNHLGNASTFTGPGTCARGPAIAATRTVAIARAVAPFDHYICRRDDNLRELAPEAAASWAARVVWRAGELAHSR